MKYKIPKAYWWYFPDEDIRVFTTTQPTYFRRFVMWLFHNAEFVIEYKEVDTQNIKQYQKEMEMEKISG